MPELVFRPNEKQMQAITATCKNVGYGGARGGGKSWLVRVKATLLCLRWKGIKVLIVRKTYRELDNNHIQPLRQLLLGLARYNSSDKRFTFPNGSTISFGYCATDGDLDQYQGAEYDVIFLDEATQLKEDWIRKIRACCRGVNGFPKRIYYTCNPGGVSHAYFKRIFVDRRFEQDEDPNDYTFIQALVTDNQALMDAQPEYIKQLDALPPKLRKAWRDGSWDIFEGQFFEDFVDRPEFSKERKWTHVISAKDFKLPKSWEIYRSFDWGYAKPFSCGWWAVDYDGVIYRIAELFGVQRAAGSPLPDEGLKWPPDRVFAEIAKMEREHPLLAGKSIQGVADPAIWDAESGESIAETATRFGVYFSPGDHKRIPGWMQCHYRLQFDEEGYPRMYVLDSCRDFIRTIPSLQYDEHRPEDLDTKGEDHAADEWRYFCMSRPISPIITEGKPHPAWGSDPLNLFASD